MHWHHWPIDNDMFLLFDVTGHFHAPEINCTVSLPEYVVSEQVMFSLDWICIQMTAWLNCNHTDNTSQSQEGSSCAKLPAQLGSSNSEIIVQLTWPFCMDPEVDSYKTDAHNLTNAETTYNIIMNIWFILIGTIHIASVHCYHSSSTSPIFTKLAPQPQ